MTNPLIATKRPDHPAVNETPRPKPPKSRDDVVTAIDQPPVSPRVSLTEAANIKLTEIFRQARAQHTPSTINPYHSWGGHVANALSAAFSVFGVSATSSIGIGLAYHDVVYVAGVSKLFDNLDTANESLSAATLDRTARRVLGRRVDPRHGGIIDRVVTEAVALIGCTTIDHHLSNDAELWARYHGSLGTEASVSFPDVLVMLDCDLSGLGCEDYSEFVDRQDRIIIESSSTGEWGDDVAGSRHSCANFLKQLLPSASREGIFRTSLGRAAWEKRAMKNITTFVENYGSK